MRVACVLVTHLRARIELRRQPHLDGRPAVIVDRAGGRPVVVDFLPATVGVAAGMTLEQALSRHAEAAVIEADEPAYRKAFHRMLTSLQAVGDRVERSDLGVAYVRMDGLERLYRGEAGLVCALLDAVPAYLAPRVGVADAKFPALVAARTAEALGARQVPADVRAFLAPHSVDLLPISPEVKTGLKRFGLRTMRDVAAMPEGAVVDQFGPAGRRAWRLSRGGDDSPLAPMKHEEAVAEHASLPFTSASIEVLFVAVDSLLRKAYARPELRGRYAGGAAVECLLHREATWERTFRFKQAAGNWQSASRIVRSRLETDHPRAPVEEVTLALSDLTGESGLQLGLTEDMRDSREQRLVEVDRRLRGHMNGGHALYRVVEVAPWHPAPEMRALRVPIDPSGRQEIGSLSAPVAVAVREGPDRQPAAVRLGGHWRRVADVEDTWSFDLWWMPRPLARTYHRIRVEDGSQLTLFRDRDEPRWYRQSA